MDRTEGKNSCTIIIGDLNTLLSIRGLKKKNRQKICKEVEVNTINHQV